MLLGTLIIDQHEVQLEVVKIVEDHPNEMAPVEHELVKHFWFKQITEQEVSHFLWDNVENLVEHPDHFGCRGAVIEVEQHLYSFIEKREVEVWRDQGFVPMDLREPLGYDI